MAAFQLGSAAARCARLSSGRHPVLVPDKRNEQLLETPSALKVCSDALLLGQLADETLDHEPGVRVLHPPARIHGLAGDSFEALPVDFPDSAAQAGLLLRKLADDCGAHAGAPPEAARITVPPWYDAMQRRALCEAATYAELDHTRLVSEATAVARFADDQSTRKLGCVAVLHVGARTCWAAVTEQSGGRWEPLSCAFRLDLGGESYDEAAVRWMARQLGLPTRDWEPYSPQHAELLRAARTLKHRTAAGRASRGAFLIGGRVRNVALGGEFYTEHAGDIGRRIVGLLDEACGEARRDWRSIDVVRLTGGGARLSALGEEVRRYCSRHRVECFDERPEAAAVFGALLVAEEQTTPAEATPIAEPAGGVVGIIARVAGRDAAAFMPLFDLNTVAARQASATLYVQTDGQRRLTLEFARCHGARTTPLGKLLAPLGDARRGDPVELAWNIDGAKLTFTARHLRSGLRETMTWMPEVNSTQRAAASLGNRVVVQ